VTEDLTAVGNDLLRATARLNRWATRHASFDVPYAQARLLALLDELGPARVSVLAEADNSSQPTLTTQVQRLEASGWARREADPDDARATLISLTADGRAALEEVRRARYDALAPVLEHLDAADQAHLREAVALLQRVVAATAAVRSTPLPRTPSRED
jgi:DNA-binding MarR family transcriptional regulator